VHGHRSRGIAVFHSTALNLNDRPPGLRSHPVRLGLA